MDNSLKSRMAEFLDPEQVTELRSIPSDGGLDLFSDVVGLFLRTTPELLEKIEQALQAGNLETVSKQAHMLKGSSSNLGAFRFSEKSHRLEQGALKGQADLEILFDEISKDFEDLRILLDEVVKSPLDSE